MTGLYLYLMDALAEMARAAAITAEAAEQAVGQEMVAQRYDLVRRNTAKARDHLAELNFTEARLKLAAYSQHGIFGSVLAVEDVAKFTALLGKLDELMEAVRKL